MTASTKRKVASMALVCFTWSFVIQPSFSVPTVRKMFFGQLVSAVSLLGPSTAHAQTPPDPERYYSINRVPGHFIDISLAGARVDAARLDEGGFAGIPIGFEFQFFGTVQSSVSITSNGYLSFSPGVSPLNQPLPTTDALNGLIAPFWDDLNPQLNPDSAVLYQTVGEAPNRSFIVQWSAVPLKVEPDSRLTFEVVLFEGAHEIQFQYFTMEDGTGATGTGRASGLSASVGIESPDGVSGAQIGFNRGGLVASGTGFALTLGGTAFSAGTRLGDADGDGAVTVLDLALQTDILSEVNVVRSARALVALDVAPEPGIADAAFGDGVLDPQDHQRLFQVVMGRDALPPTVAGSSFVTAPGGASLTLFGSGFDPVAGNNTVLFVAVDGSTFSAPAASVSGDGSQLTVTVPPGAQFVVSLFVTRGGQTSNTVSFAVEGAPVITELSPDSGESGDTVRIRGHEFGATTGDNAVRFNGVTAPVLSVSAAEFLDELIVSVPSGATSGPVTVTASGRTSNGIDFLLDGPPTVALTAPAEGAEVTAAVDIVGTAFDLRLVDYRLEYAPVGETFALLASGTASVTNGVLGSLDPTLLVNGLYELRLTAEDENGNVVSATQGFQVVGLNKPGVFAVTFTDLRVPVSGIDITVQRKYDSRRKQTGDLGIGWSMEILDVSLEENREMGDGWYAVNTGTFFPNWELRPAKVHIVMVTFPDGRTDVFEMNAYFEDPFSRAGQSAFAEFVPRSGTTSSLAAFGGNDLIFIGGSLLDIDTMEPYDPNEYLLTTMDGRRLVIDQVTGLESLTDPNGNTLSIGLGGIVHSTGQSISFERDPDGRIERITDPAGNAFLYGYDDAGDLVSFTSRTGDMVTYEYDTEHNLVGIRDPLDQPLLGAEYDENGRLVATRDAAGNWISLAHDPGNYTTVVTDRLGQPTVYLYDERGNVLRKTDPLGNAWVDTYDGRDNHLTATDPLGNGTQYTYDSLDNLLSVTDPLGNVTGYTYNARGDVLTVTDPLGNVTTNAYDARGNLLTRTDAAGHVRTYAYDARGNPLTETDPLGNVTSYEYDAAGRLTRETTPCGGDTRYEYDALGHRVGKTAKRTTAAGPEDVVTQYRYDAEGRLVETVFHDGLSTASEYDASGNRSAAVDRMGRRTGYEYTPGGLLSRVVYPDGTAETTTYDPEGHLATFTDRDGGVTSHVYDALGREVQTVYPDGTSARKTYAANGRVLSEIDENGNATTYEHDPAGRMVSEIDALGNTTAYGYDATGRTLSVTHSDGSVHRYEYDAVGRRTRVVFPDGTAEALAYDATGLTVSRTDAAGLVTTYGYDACRRLARVTDAAGAATTYTYDEPGNRRTQTDANGNTTSWAYDAFGRPTTRTLPLGMSETLVYDGVGNRTAHTDFNGDTTSFAYDVANRPTSKAYPDGSAVTYAYTVGGRRASVTDARGTTTYVYDARGRLLRTTDPEGASVVYAYDAAGNRTSVAAPAGVTLYRYDALNRLAGLADPSGGETTYAYDSRGNVVSVDYPNGTGIRYGYDALGRVLSVENVGPGGAPISRYAYTLGPAGNRLRGEEDGARSVEYTYDALYRLVEERITDPVVGDRTTAYSYDAAGNRLSRVDSVEGTIAYTYDANDRLLTEGGASYTYDDNGNVLTRVGGTEAYGFAYDFEDRLSSAATPAGDLGFVYDADGLRVGTTVNGVETRYVLDANRDHAQVLDETDGVGNLVAAYVYGLDRVGATRGGAAEYYHPDGQGSVRQLSDAAGDVTDRYTYGAFGGLLARDGTSDNPFLYLGEQWDPSLEQYYLRARYYDPGIGRFLTADPVQGVSSEPRSLHRYVYGWNDPVNRVDPSGEQVSLAGMMVVVSIIAILASIALPGCKFRRDRHLWLNFEYWDSHADWHYSPPNIAQIESRATSVVETDFTVYDVTVNGAGSADWNDKIVHVQGYGEYEGNEGEYGHAILNGRAGEVWLGTIMNQFSRPQFGYSPGSPNNGVVGQIAGNVISHEAGHLYGLRHNGAAGNLMRAGNLNTATSIQQDMTWSAADHRHLSQRDVLGLKE